MRGDGPPGDPNLTSSDEPMGISEMAVILVSPGVAPANFKVAELFLQTDLGTRPSAWASSAAS